ncbi:MAG TPA: hypothetical protein VFX70_03785, partial [Mycobacteriales bacterium]|nr:hypothetical protein [Mycobacteriales bacterium]
GGLSSLTVRLVAGNHAGKRAGNPTDNPTGRVDGHPAGGLGHRRVYPAAGLAAGLAATGTLGYLLLATMRPWAMVPAVVIGYGAGWGWMGLLAFAAARRFPASAGWSTGVVQSGAAVGGCLGPLAFGFAVVRFGYSWTWAAVAVVNCLGAAVLTLAARGTSPAPAAPPGTEPAALPGARR